MLILILVDVQYSKKELFLLSKRFKSSKSLLLWFPSPGKKNPPSKMSDSPLGEGGVPPHPYHYLENFEAIQSYYEESVYFLLEIPGTH